MTQAIEAVQTVPLAMPCRKRAATSVSAFGANAKTIVATVITTPGRERDPAPADARRQRDARERDERRRAAG